MYVHTYDLYWFINININIIITPYYYCYYLVFLSVTELFRCSDETRVKLPLHLLSPEPPRYNLPLGIYPPQILAPLFQIQSVSVKSVKQCMDGILLIFFQLVNLINAHIVCF